MFMSSIPFLLRQHMRPKLHPIERHYLSKEQNSLWTSLSLPKMHTPLNPIIPWLSQNRNWMNHKMTFFFMLKYHRLYRGLIQSNSALGEVTAGDMEWSCSHAKDPIWWPHGRNHWSRKKTITLYPTMVVPSFLELVGLHIRWKYHVPIWVCI